MTEGQTPRPPMRARRRWLTRSALVTVLMTLFVSALPGAASAAPRLVPLMDCYMQDSDGMYTVVLGYRSSYWSTETISQGRDNHTTPYSYTSQLPTVFERGEQHGVAKLTISPDGLSRGNMYWSLDGNTVTFSTQSTQTCSSAQLPAFANGGALVIVLLLAGAVGVLVVRSARRAATVAAPATRTGDGPGTQLLPPTAGADLSV